MISKNNFSGLSAEKGFALATALVFLVILTILGISLMGGISLRQKMANNIQQKQLAFETAQATLGYAQNWLATQTVIPKAVSCTSNISSPEVCNTPLAFPTNIPWTAAINYTPPGLALGIQGGGIYDQPQFYIYSLGTNLSTGAQLYRITAWGSGGNANAIAVVQSIFQVGGVTGGSTPAKSLSNS